MQAVSGCRKATRLSRTSANVVARMHLDTSAMWGNHFLTACANVLIVFLKACGRVASLNKPADMAQPAQRLAKNGDGVSTVCTTLATHVSELYH